MRVLPESFTQDFADGVSHLCRCWQIIRTDGVMVGLSDHDRNLTFADTLFHANAGMDMTVIEHRSGFAVYGLDIDGIVGAPHIEMDALTAGLYDGAHVYIWLVDWQDVSNRLLLLNGFLGDVVLRDNKFTASLNAANIVLQDQAGRVYQATCDAALGDTRCGVALNAAAFQTETYIVDFTETHIIIPEQDYEGGWFTGGIIQFADGTRQDIRADHIIDGQRYIILWENIASALALNDPIILTAGCDKQFSTCKAKFSNSINFRGFPHLPSDSVLVSATKSA